jgi:uncharacterized membrane protein
MATPRTYLGRDQNLGAAVRVYMLPDALEIDELTFVEIERTRVYFDDILAITYHRAVSVLLLVLMGVMGGIFSAIALVQLAQKEIVGATVLLIFGAPFLLIFFAHLILKTDVITVFGRRTMARLRFPVRKGRARRIYRELAQKIQAAQEAAAAAQPPPPPPPEPDIPMPPLPPAAEPPPAAPQ